MAEEKKFYLTKGGIEKIKKQYQTLLGLKGQRVQKEAPASLHSGDLDPEYVAFQEDRELLDIKTAELENVLKHFELIKSPPKNKQKIVNIGATVLVKFNGETDEFKIIGALEADPLNNKISNESPIGQALLGKKVGENLVIKTPGVERPCKIVKIKYNKA